jgi:type VI secretion system protein ImpB
MPESTQHKLDRVRRPRVQITYDVETLGSIVKTELPFVVGIMADLSGNSIPGNNIRSRPLPMKDRKYVEIDRDNFDSIMKNIAPTTKLTTTGYAQEALSFSKLEDFNPINVLRNVPELKKKFESRTRLSNLVSKLDGNVELQKAFVEEFNKLMKNTDVKTALTAYIDSMAASAPAGMPLVTDAETTAGAITTSGLVIEPAADEAGEITTHFQITAITGGKLFKNDGTTEIKDGDATSFIKVVEGKQGLKFKPTDATTSVCNFTIQASKSGVAGGLIPNALTTAKITNKAASSPGSNSTPVSPGAPVVKGAETTANTPATIKITPSGAAPGNDATHFKITLITDGKLFKNDGTTEIRNDAFVTVAEGKQGLKFTPTPNAATKGSFMVEAASNATTVIPSTSVKVTITVT